MDTQLIDSAKSGRRAHSPPIDNSSSSSNSGHLEESTFAAYLKRKKKGGPVMIRRVENDRKDSHPLLVPSLQIPPNAVSTHSEGPHDEKENKTVMGKSVEKKEVKEEPQTDEEECQKMGMQGGAAAAQLDWSPYPVQTETNFSLEADPKGLEAGTTLDSTHFCIGRIPFEVALIMTPHDDSSFALTVKCNDTSQSNLWKVETTIELNIAGEVHCRKNHDFDLATNNIRFILPVTLIDIHKEGSKLVNDEGKVVIEGNISISKVEGYPCPYVYSLRYRHHHLADGAVEVEGSTFHVSRSLLALKSSFFYERFFGPAWHTGDGVLRIPGCAFNDFAALLDVIYTKDALHGGITINNVEGVLRLALRFSIPDIVISCVEFFNPRQNVPTKKLILLALRLPDEHKLAELQDECVNGIFSNNIFDSVVLPSQEYQSISPDYKELLQRKNLALKVNSE